MMYSRTLILLVCFLAAACDGARGQERTDAELRATVDSLLPRIEALSGLEAVAPIRVARRSRDEVRAYVVEELDEQLPDRIRAGMAAAYKAFGLLPDTLRLERLLVDLYTEQIMGYYDPETETLYAVEGVPAERLRPVLAHELVHALQDQHADLEAITSRERGSDRQLAAQAAIEGQATLVMFVLLAEERPGRTIPVGALPDLSARLSAALEAQNRRFPVFGSAPRIIRETLLFPYIAGASFVQALWRRQGRPSPFGGRLPLSTEQVLHPRTHFLETRDAPTVIELAAPRDSGRVRYENTLGELELSILLSEHLGPDAERLARGWDGDRYRLLDVPGSGRVLVWYSVWDGAAAADAFAEAYRRVLARRSDRHGRVRRLEVDGRPVVRVVSAEVGVAIERAAVPRIAGLREAER